MRSFSTLALLLPAVLAVPLKSATHHHHSPSCVIAGLAYPDPRHTLVLLGRRELSPPTGLSERAFTDFLILCHQSGGHSSSIPLVARQQGNAVEDPAGSDNMLGTTTPGGAPPASGDQRASSSSASPSTTPATTTSPTPSPSETPGSAAGPTSTGTPPGNETPETPAIPAGNPPSGNTAAIIPADDNMSHDTNVSETPPAQSDSSAVDTSFIAIPQGITAGFASSFPDSNVSDSFGDASSRVNDTSNSLDNAQAVDNGGEPVAVDAQSGV